AVTDELAPDHLEEFRPTVEGVGAAAVRAHETAALFDKFENRRSVLVPHRRLTVTSGLKQVPLGEHEQHVEVLQVLSVDLSAVLGDDDVKAVLFPQLDDRPFGQSKRAV